MPIESLSTFRDLLDYLSEKNAPHQVDLANQLVEMPAKAPPLDDVMYLRWEKKLPYVQIVLPVVRNVDLSRRGEAEAAICRLNDFLPVALLGFEYERRFIYLRRCLPFYEGGLDARVFERELLTTLKVGQELFVPLGKVVAGEPGAKVLDLLPKAD